MKSLMNLISRTLFELEFDFDYAQSPMFSHQFAVTDNFASQVGNPETLKLNTLEDLNYRKINLETERLILKEIPFKYKNQFFSIFSDKEVMRFTDKPITENIDEAIVYLQNCHIRSDSKEHLYLGIFLKNSSNLIGIISIYHIDLKHRFASLGILLAKTYWRKGLMTEAINRFLTFCFTELNLHRLEAQTFVDNIPAVNFFTKLNFKNEGRLRENFKIEGKYEDSYLFSLLKWEYIPE